MTAVIFPSALVVSTYPCKQSHASAATRQVSYDVRELLLAMQAPIFQMRGSMDAMFLEIMESLERLGPQIISGVSADLHRALTNAVQDISGVQAAGMRTMQAQMQHNDSMLLAVKQGQDALLQAWQRQERAAAAAAVAAAAAARPQLQAVPDARYLQDLQNQIRNDVMTSVRDTFQQLLASHGAREQQQMRQALEEVRVCTSGILAACSGHHVVEWLVYHCF